jgi:hypothetical protein
VAVNNNIEYQFKLPKIHQKGYVLTTKTSQDFFKLYLRSNFSTSDSVFVKAQARGTTFSTTKVKWKNGKINVAFQKNVFPEGIVTFTVFNQQKQPICERLVFNYKEENNRLKIVAKTEKENYQQRDKVVFNLGITNNDSIKPQINTSFLAINKRQLGQIQLNRVNILSYFLLQSELKGNIEQPNFYFDTKNSQRFYAMDALLLTQGWRNYIFKASEEKIDFKYQPEKGLQISGSIEEYTKKKRRRKKPLELTLMAKGKGNLQAQISTVDSLGRFSFYLQDIFNNNLEYVLQSKNHKGKKREYTINIDKQKTLEINFTKEETLKLADKFNIYVKENRKRYAKLYPFDIGLNGESLDEVIVKTRLLSPIQKKMTEKHGEPDIIIENETLIEKNEKWMSGLFSLLLYKFPNDLSIIDIPLPQVMDDEEKTVLANGTDLAFLTKNGIIINIVDFSLQRKPIPIIDAENFRYAHVDKSLFTFAIVDGEPVLIEDYPLLENISIEEIKSVEIIKNPKNPAIYIDNVFDITPMVQPNFSFLNIYSQSGVGLYGIVNSTIGIYKKTLPSFSAKKEFYVPKHEKLTKNDWDNPDLRSTVFWNPNVTLDKNGTGKVEFYTDDNIGEMLVIIESIAEDGKIGYYETSYKVNKKIKKNDL